VGTVFKKVFTKPLPAEVEFFTREGLRYARWKDAKGKTRKALVTASKDGKPRIQIEAKTYTAKYRDGGGIVREVSTGCRDEQAARSVLADLERQAERIRTKIITKQEADMLLHHQTAIDDHRADYLAHLESNGCCQMHRDNVGRQLKRLFDECHFTNLSDMDRHAVEIWLNAKVSAGMGARTRNTYLTALIAFGNWCADPNVGRMINNPFTRMAKANEKADRRRQRRSMNEPELVSLLDVARRRPLLDAMTVRKGKRKGEAYANLRPETKENLEWLGRERALIYKTLVLTGLRRGELASLTVGQLRLDEIVPFAVLHAADEKSREGADIALRDDLAQDLREWLADKLARLQREARSRGETIPNRLPADMPLFDVPVKLSKIFNRDLRLAGIAKKDERGRTLDVHALRTTFGTLLSKGGVQPRTAQAAMRHADIGLTMGVYCDPRLLDVRGAIDSLPSLPLSNEQAKIPEAAKATGTDGLRLSPLAPTLAPTIDNRATKLSIAGNSYTEPDERRDNRSIVASADADKAKHPMTFAVNGCLKVGAKGFEPLTPSVSS